MQALFHSKVNHSTWHAFRAFAGHFCCFSVFLFGSFSLLLFFSSFLMSFFRSFLTKQKFFVCWFGLVLLSCFLFLFSFPFSFSSLISFSILCFFSFFLLFLPCSDVYRFSFLRPLSYCFHCFLRCCTIGLHLFTVFSIFIICFRSFVTVFLPFTFSCVFFPSLSLFFLGSHSVNVSSGISVFCVLSLSVLSSFFSSAVFPLISFVLSLPTIAATHGSPVAPGDCQSVFHQSSMPIESEPRYVEPVPEAQLDCSKVRTCQKAFQGLKMFLLRSGLFTTTWAYDQLVSDPSTSVENRTQRPDDSILLRHMVDVVGTGPDTHLSMYCEHMTHQSVFDGCGGVA